MIDVVASQELVHDVEVALVEDPFEEAADDALVGVGHGEPVPSRFDCSTAGGGPQYTKRSIESMFLPTQRRIGATPIAPGSARLTVHQSYGRVDTSYGHTAQRAPTAKARGETDGTE